MRSFIYLDTDILNSYLAQIFGGLIQKQDIETQKNTKKKKQHKIGMSLASKIALKLLGKGIEGDAQTNYEYLKAAEEEDILKDVKAKIMHDNAFDEFVKYVDENNLFASKENVEIGNFVSIEDEFYIFDMNYYKNLCSENGFLKVLENVKNVNVKNTMEQKYDENNRETKRNKTTKEAYDSAIREAEEKNHKEYEAVKYMFDMLASIIPYQQILCIDNYLVVLDDKFLRDSLSMVSFKYGGKVKVVGYITNKVNAQANNPLTTFAGLADSLNKSMNMFFPNADEMYIVHPIAIYYDN